MLFPRIFYCSRCSPLKSFISTVHPSIPIYKARFLLSFIFSSQPPSLFHFYSLFLPPLDSSFHFDVQKPLLSPPCRFLKSCKPLIITGDLRLRPSAMGVTDCSRRRSSSMACCSFCTRSTQPVEI